MRPGTPGSCGAGRFWTASKLKAVRIYGIAMIAPRARARAASRKVARARADRGLRGVAPSTGAFRRCHGAARASPIRTSPSSPTGSTMACPKTPANHRSGTLGAKGGKCNRSSPTSRSSASRLRETRRIARRAAQRQNSIAWRGPSWSGAGLPHHLRFDERTEDRRNFNSQALIHQKPLPAWLERFLPWHRAYPTSSSRTCRTATSCSLLD